MIKDWDGTTEFDILQYHNLVWSTAWKFKRSCVGTLEICDLASAGFLALINVAKRWNPDGPPFLHLAYPRMRYAMIDVIRAEIKQTASLGYKDWSGLYSDEADSFRASGVWDNAMLERPNESRTLRSVNSVENRWLARIDARMCIEKAAKLSSTDADILRMFYLRDMEAKDIAPIVGLAENTIYTRLSRIKKQLRGEKRWVSRPKKKKKELKHGTLSMYRYCKCDLCKKAKSDFNHKHWVNRNVQKVS